MGPASRGRAPRRGIRRSARLRPRQRRRRWRGAFAQAGLTAQKDRPRCLWGKRKRGRNSTPWRFAPRRLGAARLASSAARWALGRRRRPVPPRFPRSARPKRRRLRPRGRPARGAWACTKLFWSGRSCFVVCRRRRRKNTGLAPAQKKARPKPAPEPGAAAPWGASRSRPPRRTQDYTLPPQTKGLAKALGQPGPLGRVKKALSKPFLAGAVFSPRPPHRPSLLRPAQGRKMKAKAANALKWGAARTRRPRIQAGARIAGRPPARRFFGDIRGNMGTP